MSGGYYDRGKGRSYSYGSGRDDRGSGGYTSGPRRESYGGSNQSNQQGYWRDSDQAGGGREYVSYDGGRGPQSRTVGQERRGLIGRRGPSPARRDSRGSDQYQGRGKGKGDRSGKNSGGRGSSTSAPSRGSSPPGQRGLTSSAPSSYHPQRYLPYQGDMQAGEFRERTNYGTVQSAGIAGKNNISRHECALQKEYREDLSQIRGVRSKDAREDRENARLIDEETVKRFHKDIGFGVDKDHHYNTPTEKWVGQIVEVTDATGTVCEADLSTFFDDCCVGSLRLVIECDFMDAGLQQDTPVSVAQIPSLETLVKILRLAGVMGNSARRYQDYEFDRLASADCVHQVTWFTREKRDVTGGEPTVNGLEKNKLYDLRYVASFKVRANAVDHPVEVKFFPKVGKVVFSGPVKHRLARDVRHIVNTSCHNGFPMVSFDHQPYAICSTHGTCSTGGFVLVSAIEQKNVLYEKGLGVCRLCIAEGKDDMHSSAYVGPKTRVQNFREVGLLAANGFKCQEKAVLDPLMFAELGRVFSYDAAKRMAFSIDSSQGEQWFEMMNSYMSRSNVTDQERMAFSKEYGYGSVVKEEKARAGLRGLTSRTCDGRELSAEPGSKQDSLNTVRYTEALYKRLDPKDPTSRVLRNMLRPEFNPVVAEKGGLLELINDQKAMKGWISRQEMKSGLDVAWFPEARDDEFLIPDLMFGCVTFDTIRNDPVLEPCEPIDIDIPQGTALFKEYRKKFAPHVKADTKVVLQHMVRAHKTNIAALQLVQRLIAADWRYELSWKLGNGVGRLNVKMWLPSGAKVGCIHYSDTHEAWYVQGKNPVVAAQFLAPLLSVGTNIMLQSVSEGRAEVEVVENLAVSMKISGGKTTNEHQAGQPFSLRMWKCRSTCRGQSGLSKKLRSYDVIQGMIEPSKQQEHRFNLGLQAILMESIALARERTGNDYILPEFHAPKEEQLPYTSEYAMDLTEGLEDLTKAYIEQYKLKPPSRDIKIGGLPGSSRKRSASVSAESRVSPTKTRRGSFTSAPSRWKMDNDGHDARPDVPDAISDPYAKARLKPEYDKPRCQVPIPSSSAASEAEPEGVFEPMEVDEASPGRDAMEVEEDRAKVATNVNAVIDKELNQPLKKGDYQEKLDRGDEVINGMPEKIYTNEGPVQTRPRCILPGCFRMVEFGTCPENGGAKKACSSQHYQEWKAQLEEREKADKLNREFLYLDDPRELIQCWHCCKFYPEDEEVKHQSSVRCFDAHYKMCQHVLCHPNLDTADLGDSRVVLSNITTDWFKDRLAALRMWDGRQEKMRHETGTRLYANELADDEEQLLVTSYSGVGSANYGKKKLDTRNFDEMSQLFAPNESGRMSQIAQFACVSSPIFKYATMADLNRNTRIRVAELNYSDKDTKDTPDGHGLGSSTSLAEPAGHLHYSWHEEVGILENCPHQTAYYLTGSLRWMPVDADFNPGRCFWVDTITNVARFVDDGSRCFDPHNPARGYRQVLWVGDLYQQMPGGYSKKFIEGNEKKIWRDYEYDRESILAGLTWYDKDDAEVDPTEAAVKALITGTMQRALAYPDKAKELVPKVLSKRNEQEGVCKWSQVMSPKYACDTAFMTFVHLDEVKFYEPVDPRPTASQMTDLQPEYHHIPVRRHHEFLDQLRKEVKSSPHEKDMDEKCGYFSRLPSANDQGWLEPVEDSEQRYRFPDPDKEDVIQRRPVMVHVPYQLIEGGVQPANFCNVCKLQMKSSALFVGHCNSKTHKEKEKDRIENLKAGTSRRTMEELATLSRIGAVVNAETDDNTIKRIAGVSNDTLTVKRGMEFYVDETREGEQKKYEEVVNAAMNKVGDKPLDPEAVRSQVSSGRTLGEEKESIRNQIQKLMNDAASLRAAISAKSGDDSQAGKVAEMRGLAQQIDESVNSLSGLLAQLMRSSTDDSEDLIKIAMTVGKELIVDDERQQTLTAELEALKSSWIAEDKAEGEAPSGYTKAVRAAEERVLLAKKTNVERSIDDKGAALKRFTMDKELQKQFETMTDAEAVLVQKSVNLYIQELETRDVTMEIDSDGDHEPEPDAIRLKQFETQAIPLPRAVRTGQYRRECYKDSNGLFKFSLGRRSEVEVVDNRAPRLSPEALNAHTRQLLGTPGGLTSGSASRAPGGPSLGNRSTLTLREQIGISPVELLISGDPAPSLKFELLKRHCTLELEFQETYTSEEMPRRLEQILRARVEEERLTFNAPTMETYKKMWKIQKKKLKEQIKTFEKTCLRIEATTSPEQRDTDYWHHLCAWRQARDGLPWKITNAYNLQSKLEAVNQMSVEEQNKLLREYNPSIDQAVRDFDKCRVHTTAADVRQGRNTITVRALKLKEEGDRRTVEEISESLAEQDAREAGSTVSSRTAISERRRLNLTSCYQQDSFLDKVRRAESSVQGTGEVYRSGPKKGMKKTDVSRLPQVPEFGSFGGDGDFSAQHYGEGDTRVRFAPLHADMEQDDIEVPDEASPLPDIDEADI